MINTKRHGWHVTEDDWGNDIKHLCIQTDEPDLANIHVNKEDADAKIS